MIESSSCHKSRNVLRIPSVHPAHRKFEIRVCLPVDLARGLVIGQRRVYVHVIDVRGHSESLCCLVLSRLVIEPGYHVRIGHDGEMHLVVCGKFTVMIRKRNIVRNRIGYADSRKVREDAIEFHFHFESLVVHNGKKIVIVARETAVAPREQIVVVDAKRGFCHQYPFTESGQIGSHGREIVHQRIDGAVYPLHGYPECVVGCVIFGFAHEIGIAPCAGQSRQQLGRMCGRLLVEERQFGIEMSVIVLGQRIVCRGITYVLVSG